MRKLIISQVIFSSLVFGIPDSSVESPYLNKRFTASLSIGDFGIIPLALDYNFTKYFGAGVAIDAFVPFLYASIMFTIYPRFYIPIRSNSSITLTPYVTICSTNNLLRRLDLLSGRHIQPAEDVGLLIGYEFRKRFNFRAQIGPVFSIEAMTSKIYFSLIYGVSFGISF